MHAGRQRVFNPDGCEFAVPRVINFKLSHFSNFLKRNTLQNHPIRLKSPGYILMKSTADSGYILAIQTESTGMDWPWRHWSTTQNGGQIWELRQLLSIRHIMKYLWILFFFCSSLCGPYNFAPGPQGDKVSVHNLRYRERAKDIFIAFVVRLVQLSTTDGA